MLLPRPARASGIEAKSALQKALAAAGDRPKKIITLLAVLAVGSTVLISVQLLNTTPDLYDAREEDMPFWDESVPEYRARIAEMMPHRRPGTIFVSIASFRDNLCQLTLQRIFEKAKDPSRVILGVCDQLRFDDPEDEPCETLLTDEQKKNVRLVKVKAENGGGPTHARYIASKLWDGEEIYMQIDGHSNFVQDWDEGVFENFDALPDPYKSVITHYPTAGEQFLGKDQLLPWICKSSDKNAPPGLLIQLPDNCADRHRTEGLALTPDGKKTTCHTPFLGAGFFAGRSTLLLDAPYDKYLKFLFHGEEVLIASRLWTSGWELYTPWQNFVSHAYGGRDKNVFVEVPTWYIDAKRSEARAREILDSQMAEDTTAEYDRSEIEDLGMGKARPLKAYMDYAGLDLKNDVRLDRCESRFDMATYSWVDAKQSA